MAPAVARGVAGEATIHRLHPYAAKFPPRVPRSLIETYSAPSDTVLDPFCGSGTTLVEAVLAGRNAVGIDINPVATLVAKVKSHPLTGQQVRRADAFRGVASHAFLDARGSGNGTVLKHANLPEGVIIPAYDNIDHWFQPFIQRELGLMSYLIRQEGDESVRDFLLVVFSSILVRVSNQESETRFAAVPKALYPGITLDLFNKKLSEAIRAAEEFAESAAQGRWADVITADARNLGGAGQLLEKARYDLVVTSPPYINSYDYYLYHKFRMVWLGYDPKSVQAAEVGSRNKFSSQREPVDTYRHDMGESLRCLSEMIKPGGFVCFVLGDGVVRGVAVRADELLVLLGARHGLEKVSVRSYTLQSISRSFNPAFAAKEKREHVIVMRRKP